MSVMERLDHNTRGLLTMLLGTYHLPPMSGWGVVIYRHEKTGWYNLSFNAEGFTPGEPEGYRLVGEIYPPEEMDRLEGEELTAAWKELVVKELKAMGLLPEDLSPEDIPPLVEE